MNKDLKTEKQKSVKICLIMYISVNTGFHYIS